MYIKKNPFVKGPAVFCGISDEISENFELEIAYCKAI